MRMAGTKYSLVHQNICICNLALDLGAEEDALAVLGILQSQTHGTLHPVALATAVFDIGLLLEFLPDGTRDVLAALQMLLLEADGTSAIHSLERLGVDGGQGRPRSLGQMLAEAAAEADNAGVASTARLGRLACG